MIGGWASAQLLRSFASRAPPRFYPALFFGEKISGGDAPLTSPSLVFAALGGGETGRFGQHEKSTYHAESSYPTKDQPPPPPSVGLPSPDAPQTATSREDEHTFMHSSRQGGHKIMSTEQFESHVQSLQREYLSLSDAEFDAALKTFGIPPELGVNPQQLLTYYQHTSLTHPLHFLLKKYAFLTWFPLQGHEPIHFGSLMKKIERKYDSKNDRYGFFLASRTTAKKYLINFSKWYHHAESAMRHYVKKMEQISISHNFLSKPFASKIDSFFSGMHNKKDRFLDIQLKSHTDPLLDLLQKYVIFYHVFGISRSIKPKIAMPGEVRDVLNAFSMLSHQYSYHLYHIYPHFHEWLQEQRANFFTESTIARLAEAWQIAATDQAELLTALNRVRRPYEREKNHWALLAFYNSIKPLPERQPKHYLQMHFMAKEDEFHEIAVVVDDRIKKHTSTLVASLLEVIVSSPNQWHHSSFANFMRAMKQDFDSSSVRDKMMNRFHAASHARSDVLASLTEMLEHYSTLEHDLPLLALYDVLFEIPDELIWHYLDSHFGESHSSYRKVRSYVSEHLRKILNPVELNFENLGELKQFQQAVLASYLRQEQRLMSESLDFLPTSPSPLNDLLEAFYRRHQLDDIDKHILWALLGISHISLANLARLLGSTETYVAERSRTLLAEWQKGHLVWSVQSQNIDDLSQQLENSSSYHLAQIHSRLIGENTFWYDDNVFADSLALFKDNLRDPEEKKLFLGYILGFQHPEFFEDVTVLGEKDLPTNFDGLAQRLPWLHGDFLEFHYNRHLNDASSTNWQTILSMHFMQQLPKHRKSLAMKYGFSSKRSMSYFSMRIKQFVDYLWNYNPMMAGVFIVSNLQFGEVLTPAELSNIVQAELPNEDSAAWMMQAEKTLRNSFLSYVSNREYTSHADLRDDLMITLHSLELKPISTGSIIEDFYLVKMSSAEIGERLRVCAPQVLTDRGMVYLFYSDFLHFFNDEGVAHKFDRMFISSSRSELQRVVFHRMFLCLHGYKPHLDGEQTTEDNMESQLRLWLRRSLTNAFDQLTEAQLNTKFNDVLPESEQLNITKAQAMAFMKTLSKFHSSVFFGDGIKCYPDFLVFAKTHHVCLSRIIS